MIVKNFEQNKIDYKKNNFFLFYGENQGYKDQVIDEKFKKNFLKSTYYYDEGDILNNENNFFNNILSKSFFENEKLIIINRSTDKIIKLIRNKLGFKNIIISDDISMKALKFSLKINTQKAFTAGCNLVLHCNANYDEMKIVANNSPLINPFIIKKTSQFYKFLS